MLAGGKGWKINDFYKKFNDTLELQDKILFLNNPSEVELQQAYQKCLFTIYPSFYEGWGLSITESLCYGKISIVVRNSSLIEAADNFGVFFKTGSSEELANNVEEFYFNHKKRKEMEDKINLSFKPRNWLDLGKEIINFIKNN